MPLKEITMVTVGLTMTADTPFLFAYVSLRRCDVLHESRQVEVESECTNAGTGTALHLALRCTALHCIMPCHAVAFRHGHENENEAKGRAKAEPKGRASLSQSAKERQSD